MLHHYLKKGFKPDYILNLTETEKLFFHASMELELEEEMERLKANPFSS
jgi:hypothetical protein